MADPIDLAIDLDAPGVTQAALDVPMIPGFNAPFGDLVREYSGDDPVADMLDDGYDSADYEVQAATALKAQSPSVDAFKVGNMSAFVAQVDTIQITAAAAGDWEIECVVEGMPPLTATYTAGGGDTIANIRDALVAAFNLLQYADGNPIDVTAAPAGGDSITLTADVDGWGFTATFTPGGAGTGSLTHTTPNNGYFDELTLIADLAGGGDPNWYGLMIPSRDGAILEAARWAAGKYKLLGVQTDEAGVRSGSSSTDIASRLASLGYNETFLLSYDTNAVEGVEAWLGRKLPVDLDTFPITYWAHCTLAGISTEALSGSAEAAIKAKNANFYSTLGGNGATYEGTVASGFFIDQITTRDWLYYRLRETYWQLLSNASNRNEKYSFTDGDIRAFAYNPTRALLQKGVDIGHFSRFTIDVPRASQVDPADKTARRLRWSFVAELADAIQNAVIRGAVVRTLP